MRTSGSSSGASAVGHGTTSDAIRTTCDSSSIVRHASVHDFSSAAIPVHPASWLVVRSKRISTAPIRSSGFECSLLRTTDVVAMIENSLRTLAYRVGMKRSQRGSETT